MRAVRDLTHSRSVIGTLVAVVALAIATSGCGYGSSKHPAMVSRDVGAIGGAGAAVPAPLIDAWGRAYHARTGTTISYAIVGSGNGIAQTTSGVSDFGVSGVPLNAVEQAAAQSKKTSVLEVPVARAALAVVYRVPGVGPGLRLDATTLAAMFGGSITRWDAPAIRRLNPGVALPSIAVVPVHRAESSAATATLTTFLARGNRAWARTVGAGKVVRWPIGIAVTAHQGVPRKVANRPDTPDEGPARAVAARPGAIGYVGVAAAQRAGLASAWLPAGGGYAPPAADGAYPLVDTIDLLVFQDPCRAHKATDLTGRLKHWLAYVTGPGQNMAKAPAFAPLLPDAAATAQARIRSLRCDGKPVPTSG
jgi:phosphate transport system substrate-binding protein